MAMSTHDRKSEKPGKGKPAASPDDLTKSKGPKKVELTEDELRKVSGGLTNRYNK
jgi:bacteriocin-like protein